MHLAVPTEPNSQVEMHVHVHAQSSLTFLDACYRDCLYLGLTRNLSSLSLSIYPSIHPPIYLCLESANHIDTLSYI